MHEVDASSRTISLCAQDAEQVTNGRWTRLGDPAMRFTAVTTLAKVHPGALVVVPDGGRKWRKAGAAPPSREELGKAVARGAAAFLVGNDQEYDVNAPLLAVDSTWDALAALAEANRDRTRAKRILVTGSVGKTSYKLMVRHALRGQLSVHAVPDSSNLNVPIWCSLASIAEQDDLAVIEVSVANPGRGRQRTAYIKPHICVLTNISPSHTRYHGSLDALIHNKAEVILGLEPGGVCLMSADHPYFVPLKAAVQRMRPVPVLTWGREPFNDACLTGSEFDADRGHWSVSVQVMGHALSYTVGTHHSFAPVVSLATLLTAAYLGLDLEEVAGRLADFSAGETAGRVLRFPLEGGGFTVFDYSLRGSIEGFRAAFADLYRMTDSGHRILLALGESRDLADDDHQAVHEEIAGLVRPGRVDALFTVGEGMHVTRAAVADPGILERHGDTPEAIQEALFGAIRPGDVVFVQGHHRVWMSRLIAAMTKRFGQPTAAAEADSDAAPAVQPPARMQRLLAGGDLMLSRDLPGRIVEEGPEWVFGPLAEAFGRADAVLANLECVLSSRGDFYPKSGERRPFHYRAPRQTVEVLLRAGFTAVTTANNHSMDFGPAALADQAALLSACGIAHAGSGPDREQARRWAVLRCGAVDVALVAFDATAPWAAAGDDWGVYHRRLDGDAREELAALIQAAREHAHLVIVSPHWGPNWREAPSTAVRGLARALIDSGADAILGHSAHVLQGVEVYRGRPIVYDMGSLVFDRVSDPRMRDSGLFELTFDGRGFHELIVHPLRLSRCRVRWAEGEDRTRIAQRLADLSAALEGEVAAEVDEGAVRFRLSPDEDQREVAGPPPAAAVSRPDPGCCDNEGLAAETPAAVESAEAFPIELGGGLAVGGVRHPDEVAPGYAFVHEVRFRCREAQALRWRGELMFVPFDGGEPTIYRYPLADGIWHAGQSGSGQWFADRILCRPPELEPGRYRVLWTLWCRDGNGERLYWGGHRSGNRVPVRVETGDIHVTADAPAGVAGVHWATDLEWTAPTLCYRGARPPAGPSA